LGLLFFERSQRLLAESRTINFPEDAALCRDTATTNQKGFIPTPKVGNNLAGGGGSGERRAGSSGDKSRAVQTLRIGRRHSMSRQRLDCVCLTAALSRAEMDGQRRSNGHFFLECGFVGVPLLRRKSRRWHSQLCQKYPMAQIQRGLKNVELPVFSTFLAHRYGWHCPS